MKVDVINLKPSNKQKSCRKSTSFSATYNNEQANKNFEKSKQHAKLMCQFIAGTSFVFASLWLIFKKKPNNTNIKGKQKA